MLTGKRFTLGRATVAVEMVDGKRSAVTIPEGTTIKVSSGPPSDGLGLVNVPWEGLVNVVWENRAVAMFSLDLKERGTEIADFADPWPTSQSGCLSARMRNPGCLEDDGPAARGF